MADLASVEQHGPRPLGTAIPGIPVVQGQEDAWAAFLRQFRQPPRVLRLPCFAGAPAHPERLRLGDLLKVRSARLRLDQARYVVIGLRWQWKRRTAPVVDVTLLPAPTAAAATSRAYSSAYSSAYG